MHTMHTTKEQVNTINPNSKDISIEGRMCARSHYF